MVPGAAHRLKVAPGRVLELCIAVVCRVRSVMQSRPNQKIEHETGDSGLQIVPSLRKLCIMKARLTALSTELLLSLPQEILRDLYGGSSRSSHYTLIISDLPLQSDGNRVRGAICGFSVLTKEFLFGEYEAAVFQEPLENATWKNAAHVREIVMIIQDFFYQDETSNAESETSLAASRMNVLTLENGKRVKAALYQQVARWVLINNCYFACNLTDEFVKIAQSETLKLVMRVC